MQATVVRNLPICREHHRLVLRVDVFPRALPGQFVHLVEPLQDTTPQVHIWEPGTWPRLEALTQERMTFRRAFSIARLQHRDTYCDLDVVYRVVGKGTRWMAGLQPGAAVDLLGPVGNHFQAPAHLKLALLVGGGVGLPPMFYWAEALAAAGVRSVAFCGAQSADLLALTCNPETTVSADGSLQSGRTAEFDPHWTATIIATDDGSLGLRGLVTDALRAYVASEQPDAATTAVYTCGPEPMMRAVSRQAASWNMFCQACMERSMACGMGTCQSCVVPIAPPSMPQRYQLCCTDGPVFDAAAIVWD